VDELNDKDKKKLHETIKNMDMSPILGAADIMNQFSRTADTMNSMDMSPILWAADSINSMNMTPILRAVEVINSMDMAPLINSLKGIDTLYINSEFLSSETLSSLKNIDSDKDINIAIPVKEPIEGCEPVKNDFNIIPIKKFDNALKGFNKLEKAIEKLENLLESECNEESQYQSLLKENPVMFGYMYSEINSHKTFDDKNIPDFTGVRVTDKLNSKRWKKNNLRLFKK